MRIALRAGVSKLVCSGSEVGVALCERGGPCPQAVP